MGILEGKTTTFRREACIVQKNDFAQNTLLRCNDPRYTATSKSNRASCLPRFRSKLIYSAIRQYRTHIVGHEADRKSHHVASGYAPTRTDIEKRN